MTDRKVPDIYREKAKKKPIPSCFYDWRNEVEGLRRFLEGQENYLEYESAEWVENMRNYNQARFDLLQETDYSCTCTNKTGCQKRSASYQKRKARRMKGQPDNARIGDTSTVRNSDGT